jgi:uncharacterized integral membrane protein
MYFAEYSQITPSRQSPPALRVTQREGPLSRITTAEQLSPSPEARSSLWCGQGTEPGRMSAILKAAILLGAALAALVGFIVLETTKAVLWLLFLAVAYPVLVAFMSSALDGTRFTPAQLIAIYKESIRALPKLFGFLKDLIFRSKQ